MSITPHHKLRAGSPPAVSSGRVRRIRADLGRGHNSDLYIAVTVAIVVAVLGIVGVVDERILAASTLAVLAVMATSALSSRHQLEDVATALAQLAASQVGNTPADRFLSATPPGRDLPVGTATEIGLVGVTLTRTIRDMLPVLDRRLRAGAKIRVLLIDVDSDANIEAVSRSKKADASDFYRNRVSSSIDLLRVLAEAARDDDDLQLRLLPFVPTFGMCLTDSSDAHGRIQVEMYQHRTLEGNPSFDLRAGRDQRWYALFTEQFETMWASGRPLALSADQEPSGFHDC
jgi:hypothetical protein